MKTIGSTNPKSFSSRTFSRQTGAARLGCFGQTTVLFLMLVGLGVLYAALNPWAFFLGGNFHPLGYWRGWGRVQSKTAGDHFLYVEIYPNMHSRGGVIPATPVTGKAWLCTPHGEHFYLTLGGGMPFGYYVNSLGKPIHIYMSKWQAGIVLKPDNRPSFQLYGHWERGELVADDHKTLSAAFLPDGTLRPLGSSVFPAQYEDTSVTLHEGSYSEFKSACRE